MKKLILDCAKWVSGVVALVISLIIVNARWQRAQMKGVRKYEKSRKQTQNAFEKIEEKKKIEEEQIKDGQAEEVISSIIDRNNRRSVRDRPGD